MEFIGQFNLVLHIIAGTLTLLLGPVAIISNNKNLRWHKPAGKIFYYAMLIVCATAFLAFLQGPGRIFYQFLVGIAIFVWATIFRGVRALQFMKGNDVQKVDYVYTGLLGIAGAGLVARGLLLLSTNAHIAFPILFCVFGVSALRDTTYNLKVFRNAEEVHKLDWLALHANSMIGAFIAATTAFTVNAAPFLPWYLQWFGPTLLFVPVQIYFGRKIRGQKKAKVQGAMA